MDIAQKDLKFKKNIQLDFVLVDNSTIKQISKVYRNKDKETDILSFPTPWQNYLFMDEIPLGEIIISYEKVKSQAREYNHSIKREYCYLFAHGIVHLYGLDHQSSEEEKEMNKIVNKLMKKIGVTR